MNHLKVCNSSVLISQDCHLKKEKFRQAGSLNNRNLFFHSSSQKPEMKAWAWFLKALLCASSFGSFSPPLSICLPTFLVLKKKILILIVLWELCFGGRNGSAIIIVINAILLKLFSFLSSDCLQWFLLPKLLPVT